MTASGYHLKRYHKIPIKYLKVVLRDLPVKYNPKKPLLCRLVIRDIFKLWMLHKTIGDDVDPPWIWTLYFDLKGVTNA